MARNRENSVRHTASQMKDSAVVRFFDRVSTLRKASRLRELRVTLSSLQPFDSHVERGSLDP